MTARFETVLEIDIVNRNWTETDWSSCCVSSIKAQHVTV